MENFRDGLKVEDVVKIAQAVTELLFFHQRKKSKPQRFSISKKLKIDTRKWTCCSCYSSSSENTFQLAFINLKRRRFGTDAEETAEITMISVGVFGIGSSFIFLLNEEIL